MPSSVNKVTTVWSDGQTGDKYSIDGYKPWMAILAFFDP